MIGVLISKGLRGYYCSIPPGRERCSQEYCALYLWFALRCCLIVAIAIMMVLQIPTSVSVINVGSSVSDLPIYAFTALRDQRVIDAGAFGEVREAFIDGRSRVALKTSRFAGAIARSSISKELASLKDIMRKPHTNVARILGICIDMPDGDVGIVMEFCAGGSLTSFLKQLPRVSHPLL